MNRSGLSAQPRAEDTIASSRRTSAAATDLPKRGEPVVAAALVVEVWVGALVGFLDEAVGQEALDGRVDGARPELDGAGGDAPDLVHDRVPVALLRPDGQEDVHRDAGQGRGRLGLLRGGGHARDYISIGCIVKG